VEEEMESRFDYVGPAISRRAVTSGPSKTSAFQSVLGLWLICCCIVAAVGPAGAQSTGTSTILGTVSDTSGATLPQSTVTIKNAAIGLARSATPGSTGDYVFPSLPTGLYQVTVTSKGFETFVQNNVLLQSNQTARVDAKMEVGSTSEIVNVDEAPPLLNTTENTVSTVIDQKRVEELPLNGRNPLQLTLLVPGVTPNSGLDAAISSTRPEQQYISTNGGRGNTTFYRLDGGDNNDNYTNLANVFPNPDALQEFNFQSNNYSAESGWRLGGVVNAVTRSGTNKFHGSIFEYVRNSYFNATNFFTPHVSDGLKRNQYGASLGGPIFRDKTFFFANWQATSVRQTVPAGSAVVPTAAELNGNFSAIQTQLVDPLTNAPFTGNQISPSRFDPVAIKLSNYLPKTSSAAGTVPISTFNNYNDQQFTGRIDHELTTADRITGRYLYDQLVRPDPIDPTNFLSSSRLPSFYSNNMTLSDTHLFSSSLLATANFTFNRVKSVFNYGYPVTLADLGADIYNVSVNKDIALTVGSYFAIPTVAASEQARTDFEEQLAFEYTKGRHDLKIGGDLIRQQFNLPNIPFDSDGNFAFTSQRSGNNLVDFLLGAPAEYIQSGPQTEALRAWLPAVYANDNFRLTHNLTLNLGLRYQPFLPWIDQHSHQVAIFSPGEQSTLYPNMPPGILVGGDPGVPDTGYRGNLAEFEPRVGFAWQFASNMTFRGGFGLFHEFPVAILNNHISLAPPFDVNITIQNPGSIVDPFTASQPNPFPTTFPPPTNYKFSTPIAATVYAANFTNARSEQYNASVEVQLARNWLATISYLGSHDTDLFGNEELDPATFGPGASLANINQRRPYYPNYGSVAQIESTGYSNYNGLAFQIEKKLQQHYSLLASYTWAHSLDLSSAEEAGGVGQFYTNPANRAYDYASSDFDIRNRFVASLTADSAGIESGKRVRYLFADWKADMIVSVQSGAPFTVLDGVNQSLNGVAGPMDRPNLVGNPNLSTDRSDTAKAKEYFNTAAYVLNPIGTYGTTSRNNINAPGDFDIDLAVVRAFPIHGSLNGQFRVEVFNALNKVNFIDPNSTSLTPANASLNSPLFGELTTANDPRIFQFALRLNF
jgi:Carboxypeptidase regulatory-like domain/TonB dependent receptor